MTLGLSKLNLGNFRKITVLLLVTILATISRWYANDIELLVKEFYPSFTTYTLSYQRTITLMPFFF